MPQRRLHQRDSDAEAPGDARLLAPGQAADMLGGDAAPRYLAHAQPNRKPFRSKRRGWRDITASANHWDQAGKRACGREQLQRDAFVLDLRAAAANARTCLARDLEHRAVAEIVNAPPDALAEMPRWREIGDVKKTVVGNVHRGDATAPRLDQGTGRAQTEACATPSFASSAAPAAS